MKRVLMRIMAVASFVTVGLAWLPATLADEAPISGTVKAIDQANQTLVLQSTAKGKTREVTILIKPVSRIVKFARATEPGKTGFVEQEIGLGDIKPGWVVSVTTKHEGNREVAEVVKVVQER